jgi:cardiolipin synthase
LAGAFVYVFWNEAERELVERDRLAKVANPPASPEVPTHRGVLTTTKTTTGLRQGVISLIAGAQRSLVVSSYGFDAAHPAVEAIRQAALRGVTVTVLTRPRPAVLAAARLFADAGILVRAHEKLHAKAILADDVGLVMTANLEKHGLDTGFEVGVRVDSGSRMLAEVLAEWEQTFPWEFRRTPPRKEVMGEVWMGDKGSRDPKGTVDDLDTVRLPTVTAADALALGQAPVPELKAPSRPMRFSCRRRFEWDVHPPTLPADAKERMRIVKRADKEGTVVEEKISYEPPVYDLKGAVYVKLRSLTEQEAARRLAAELKGVVVV